MKEILRVFKELLQYIWKTKKWRFLPLTGIIIILGFLLSASAAANVPVFVYPMV